MKENTDDKTVVNIDPGSGQKKFDFVGRISLGVIIIWLGLTRLLTNVGVIYNGDWWPYFIAGLGIILVIESFIKLTHPRYKAPYTGKLIVGLILLAIGSGGVSGLDRWWPLIVIAVGIGLVVVTYSNKPEHQNDID